MCSLWVSLFEYNMTSSHIISSLFCPNWVTPWFHHVDYSSSGCHHHHHLHHGIYVDWLFGDMSFYYFPFLTHTLRNLLLHFIILAQNEVRWMTYPLHHHPLLHPLWVDLVNGGDERDIAEWMNENNVKEMRERWRYWQNDITWVGRSKGDNVTMVAKKRKDWEREGVIFLCVRWLDLNTPSKSKRQSPSEGMLRTHDPDHNERMIKIRWNFTMIHPSVDQRWDLFRGVGGVVRLLWKQWKHWCW